MTDITVHDAFARCKIWIIKKLRTFLDLDPLLKAVQEQQRQLNIIPQLITEAKNEALNNLDQQIQVLQEQIDELRRSPQVSTEQKSDKKAEAVQVVPGHTRFSQRKRLFEAQHRRKAPEQSPGAQEIAKQIEHNNTLMSSGTKKPAAE